MPLSTADVWAANLRSDIRFKELLLILTKTEGWKSMTQSKTPHNTETQNRHEPN